jgi:hypothetical protein
MVQLVGYRGQLLHSPLKRWDCFCSARRGELILTDWIDDNNKRFKKKSTYGYNVFPQPTQLTSLTKPLPEYLHSSCKAAYSILFFPLFDNSQDLFRCLFMTVPFMLPTENSSSQLLPKSKLEIFLNCKKDSIYTITSSRVEIGRIPCLDSPRC